MSKFVRPAALAILAIAIIVGVSAMWAETLRINVTVETGELDWEFVSPPMWIDACGLPPGYGQTGGYDWNASSFPDPGAIQLDKDVGCTEVVLIDTDSDGDKDTMNVTLHNVYPWYYTHIAFAVHNDGTIPLKIWRIVVISQEGMQYFYEINAEEVEDEGLYMDLDGDGFDDVVMWWGDNFGVQLHPCQSADISLTIVVLQEAPENEDLTFQIQLQAVQWNEYMVPI